MPISKQKIAILLACGLVCFFGGSCGGTTVSKDGPPIHTNIGLSGRQFDFYDRDKYKVEVNSHWSDGENRYLIDFNKFGKEQTQVLGRFFALSIDGGRTFGESVEVSRVLKGADNESGIVAHLDRDRIAIALSKQNRIYFSVSQNGLNGFRPLEPVSDLPVRGLRLSGLVSPLEGRYYITWQEERDGQLKIVASVSENDGKSWSVSLPIERGSLSGNQEKISLGVGRNGRLHAAWMDWSDPRTLVDIRYAFSDDFGISWSASKKLNDDELAVWQMDPSLTAKDGNVLVAFSDFREDGNEDDKDWNVYLAKSTDNGETWVQNRRLNLESAARQVSPVCRFSNNEGVYCVYLSTRETVFGRLVASVSPDTGETWTNESPLSEPDEFTTVGPHTIAILSGGRVAITYETYESNKSIVHLIEAAPGLKPVDLPPRTNPDALPRNSGDVLFSDDFTASLPDAWDEKQGLWETTDGAYGGVGNARGAKRYSGFYFSFATYELPDSFEMSGRFKLDSVAHTSTVILFGVKDDSFFSVTNQFRRGAWIASDNNPPGTSPNLLHYPGWTQTAFAQKPYSFKHSTWYRFKLVVTPDQVDYYVNDELFFSGRPENKVPSGKIGIGGHGISPVFFDDIEVRSYRNET